MPDDVSKVIARAARATLAPLGLRRRGHSRLWIDDRGWWTINVEFQPSGFANVCYLNVGHQHLWVRRNRIVLGECERALGGSNFVRYDGDDDEFAAAVDSVVAAAAEAVERRRIEHGEGAESLQRLANGRDDLDGGIAAAILGLTGLAERRLKGSVHGAFRDQANSFVGLPVIEAASAARTAVDETRGLLRLPEAWSDWAA